MLLFLFLHKRWFRISLLFILVFLRDWSLIRSLWCEIHTMNTFLDEEISKINKCETCNVIFRIIAKFILSFGSFHFFQISPEKTVLVLLKWGFQFHSYMNSTLAAFLAILVTISIMGINILVIIEHLPEVEVQSTRSFCHCWEANFFQTRNEKIGKTEEKTVMT